MILQNENLQGAEGMKRISVRIIQSLSDYPGNMELCQVEEVVIVGVQFLFTTVCRVGVHVRTNACAQRACCFFEQQWHFCTLIEIISMRIEPSQLTSVLRDYCVSLNSTSPSAFTFRFREQRSISAAAA